MRAHAGSLIQTHKHTKTGRQRGESAESAACSMQHEQALSGGTKKREEALDSVAAKHSFFFSSTIDHPDCTAV